MQLNITTVISCIYFHLCFPLDDLLVGSQMWQPVYTGFWPLNAGIFISSFIYFKVQKCKDTEVPENEQEEGAERL